MTRRPAKKTAAKKAARTPAKRPARKQPAKKATAKKVTAKKQPAGKAAPRPRPATSDAPVLLELSGVTKAFGGLVAVRDFDFAAREGEIVGLIGPNGSGKTTTLNLISGELGCTAGTIRFDGHDITRKATHARIRQRIARTFQLVRVLPGMTVVENVMAGALFGADGHDKAHARDKAMELLEFVGLADQARGTGGELTYIDQKRVELARALASRPRLLLLDEWLSGLNPTELKTGMDLVGKVSASGITIVLVEHVMVAVRSLCRHVAVMNAGARIAEGTPEVVLRDAEVVKAYIGEDDA